MTELTTADEIVYTDDAILAGRDEDVMSTGPKRALLSGLATYMFGKLFPSLVAQAGNALIVNATEDGLEWGAAPGGGGGGGGVVSYLPSKGVTLTRVADSGSTSGEYIVEWSTVVVEDDAALWDISDPTKVVIQEAGWYSIAAETEDTNSGPARVTLARIKVNGVAVYQNTHYMPGAFSTIRTNISTALKLNAGDYVEFAVQTYGGATSYIGSQISLVALGALSGPPAQYSIGASVSWEGVDGADPTILKSNNIASVTRVSEGIYDIVFATPFPDEFYTVAIQGDSPSTGSGQSQRPHLANGTGFKTANGCRIVNAYHQIGGGSEMYSNAAFDIGNVYFTAFKDATTTASIALVAGDYTVDGSESYVEFTDAAAQEVTLPAGIAVGFQISGHRGGAGAVTFAAGAGANIRSADAFLELRTQYSAFTATKINATDWALTGDLA